MVEGHNTQRRKAVDLIIYSIVMALLINFVTLYLSEDNIELDKFTFTALLCAFILVAKIVCSLYKFYKKSTSTQNIYIYIPVLTKNKKVLRANGHKLSNNIPRILNDSSKGLEEFQEAWERCDFVKFLVYENNNIKFLNEIIEVCRFMEKSIELSILDSLAMTTGSYYEKALRSGKMKKESITNIDNEYLKKNITGNEFLNTLLTPLSVRYPESSHNDHKPITENTIYNGRVNSYYEIINIPLPKNSSIKKNNNNEILIDTPKITITIKIRVLPTEDNLDFKFSKPLYGHSYSEIRGFSGTVECVYKIKHPLSPFQINTAMYGWVEKFKENSLEEYCLKHYAEKINLDQLMMLDNLKE